MAEDPKDNQDEQPVAKPGTVGRQLKVRRQALRLSLAQVELETKIRGKFLTALEAGQYDKLPNDIYSRGFVQQYASYLGHNGHEVAAAYVAERGGLATSETKRPQLERQRRLVFTGPLLAVAGLVLVLVSIGGYIVYQFSALAAPPKLEVSRPGEDSVITGSSIDVIGKTTPGSDVTINGSAILSDVDGSFHEKVALGDGLNPIKITSRSKLGKTTTEVRNVLAHLPKVDSAQATVPPAPFNGIAASVAVTATTSVVVVVDGKEVFRRTVLPGWSQLFTGTKSIVLTSGNAGATNVTITNSTTANKKLAPLGKAGEIRRNQEFSFDTVFQ